MKRTMRSTRDESGSLFKVAEISVEPREGDDDMDPIEAARNALERVDAWREELFLSRDPEFAETLREADDEFRAGETVTPDQLVRDVDDAGRHSTR